MRSIELRRGEPGRVELLYTAWRNSGVGCRGGGCCAPLPLQPPARRRARRPAKTKNSEGDNQQRSRRLEGTMINELSLLQVGVFLFSFIYFTISLFVFYITE